MSIFAHGIILEIIFALGSETINFKVKVLLVINEVCKLLFRH